MEMLDTAGRTNPFLHRRIVWMAASVIGLAGAIVIAALLLASTPAGGSTNGNPTGPSVSASLACATRSAPVNSTRAGAGSAVVPPGANAILLCRYGPNGHRVLERTVTAGSTVSRLARELNALPSAMGSYNCPSDDGESVVADFSYATDAPDPVSVGLSGCQSVSNGHVSRLGAGKPVISRIAGLIPWQGTIVGRLRVCGGPAPGGCHPTRGITSCGAHGCVHADQVAILHSLGAQYPNVKLRRGRFTVRVEPGRYRLALLVDGRHVHGKVVQTAKARVRNGRVTRVVFRISVA